jgi:hypothetical protein
LDTNSNEKRKTSLLLSGDLGELINDVVKVERTVGGGDSASDSFLKYTHSIKNVK